jgi:hypothetical protein
MLCLCSYVYLHCAVSVIELLNYFNECAFIGSDPHIVSHKTREINDNG